MAIRYYVRVSSMDQKIDRQLLAYEEADYIYIDRMSGMKRDRPELERMLADLETGDTVVVKSIDRLSRSTKDLLEIVEQIRSVQANLHILDLQIDTSTAMGKCVLTILGAIAELDRKTIKERTAEGIAIAKSQGKYKGRKKGAISLRDTETIKRFKIFCNSGLTKTDIAREFKVSRTTVYKWIEELKRRGIIKQPLTEVND